MSNYRKWVPLILGLCLVLSWYKLISGNVSIGDEYNQYLTEARKYAEDGITKYAVQNYNMALEVKSSPELYVEVANYYKGQNNTKEFVVWAENAVLEYGTSSVAYDCLLDAYLTVKDYESCYDVLEVIEKREVKSDYIEQVKEQIYYYYQLDYDTFDDVGIYSNNYCAVKSKDAWGFVDRYGSLRVGCKYPTVGAYTRTNFVSVVNAEGNAYFIDKSGSKVLVFDDKYGQFGLLADNVIAARTKDGKYEYITQDGEVLFGGYDYATTMNGGVAAVVQDGVCLLIGSDGKQLTKNTYSSVIMDEKQIVYRNERLFVENQNGKYIMIDSSGKQIGKQEYDDAKLFSSESYAAVKINGEWSFADKNGKSLSDKKYEDARSFNNGLAAVKIDGKWGFIDETGTICIEPQFDDAKDFNEKGSCFVKEDASWKLLKLYRLNREG